MGLPFLACCHQRSEIRSRIMPRKYHSVCKTRLFKNQRRNSSSSSFLSLQHKYNFGKNFINTTHVITTLICCLIFGWGAEHINSILDCGKNADLSKWNLVAHLVSLMQTVGNFMWCWNCFLLLIILSRCHSSWIASILTHSSFLRESIFSCVLVVIRIIRFIDDGLSTREKRGPQSGTLR
jgi:hypothetical protein